jgi:hypothetical protein
MSYADDLVKLRKRLTDAIAVGLIDPSHKDFFEASLIQIMNDAEKSKQNCLSTAENLKRQAAVAEGQAQAFSSMSSIIYNVINALIVQTERNKLDEARRVQELSEIDQFKERLSEMESFKKQNEADKKPKATKEKKKA